MTDAMRPHPGGLPGRLADAEADLAALLSDTRSRDPQAIAWATTKRDALAAALAAGAKQTAAADQRAAADADTSG
jgi:hypothetical protein